MNHPAKPFSNANVHRLLKPVTCCEKNISNTYLFVIMTCWNWLTKGYFTFYWSDAAVDNNKKTPPTTRRRSQRMQTQEGTPLPTTTKQWGRQDAAEDEFNKDAPKLRLRKRRWYANNDNNKETQTSKMAVVDKILTKIFSLTVSKNKNEEWSVAIPYQVFFVLNYQRKCCVQK